ncbi:single-stranded DNA-binding protein, mitochondrial, partial [Quillaja saponaria]
LIQNPLHPLNLGHLFIHSIFLPVEMSSLTGRFAKYLRAPASITSSSTLAASVQRISKLWCTTKSSDSDIDEPKNDLKNEGYDDYLGNIPDLQPQGVDPRRGWGFRGVHKAIICGKVGQTPVQKILRNGRTVTIFTVGTGGMFDQRIFGARDLPKPAQWHRIAVHNEILGTYAVQQLFKNSSVYVEGDIETRVYNDSINGEVKNIPEICVRRDGKIRLIKTGESVSNISLEELREGLI